MTRPTDHPRQVNAILAELMETLKAGPMHTCTRCGERFGPMPADLCWQCDEDDRRAEERKHRALEDLAAVDRRFKGVTLGDYDCPPGDARALAAVRAWDPSSGRGLYLYGTPGGGKSHLAFGLARRLIVEHRLRVFAAEWTSLLHRMQDTFDGRPGETVGDIRRQIERADVVLIDDMATGKATDWAVEQAWAIVQGRYQSQRPIVLTSNFELGTLGGRLGGIDGQRIVSRLAEMCERVEVRARDYRLHGGGGS